MRTEPANAGGGAAVADSQPAVLTGKSLQDVEAAYAIAQLSEQEPRRSTDCHEPATSYKADGQLAGGSSSPPRFSHLRTAVMPYAYSRVEKAAVKRKFDSRDDRAVVDSYPYKVARRQDTAGRVEMAIKSERDSFMTARRHQYLPRTNTAGDAEVVGRFVRTCAPSGREAIQHRLHITVSDPTLSPTLVSSVPSLLTMSSSSQTTLQDEKPPVLSPAVTKHSYAIPSLSQQRRDVCHAKNDSYHLWDARRATTQKHPVLLPQSHHSLVPSTRVLVPVSYNDSIEKLQGRGTLIPSMCKDHASRHGERLPSSLVSAYYSLGQMAAAAAASQIPHNHSAVRNSRAQLTRICRSQPARVDSCTMSKVRRGEFGVLSTIRQYCSQMRRRSEPGDVKRSADSDNDVAMDLTVRKRTSQNDAEKPQTEVGSTAWYSKISNCESSPSVREAELPARRWTVGQLAKHSAAIQHQLTSVSLPSSPYTSIGDNEHHHSLLHPGQHTSHDDVAVTAATAADNDVNERTLGDATEASDVIPDSQLPLKKRRLHCQHQHDDSCDMQWTSQTTSVHG